MQKNIEMLNVDYVLKFVSTSEVNDDSVRNVLIECVNILSNEADSVRVRSYQKFLACLKNYCGIDLKDNYYNNDEINFVNEEYENTNKFIEIDDASLWTEETPVYDELKIDSTIKLLSQSISVLILQENNQKIAYEFITQLHKILNENSEENDEIVEAIVYIAQYVLFKIKSNKILIASNLLSILYNLFLSKDFEHLGYSYIKRLSNERKDFVDKINHLISSFIDISLIKAKLKVCSKIKSPFIEIINSLKKSKKMTVLIIHNINESLKDEWIRNSELISTLISYNADITILSQRSYLYNNPCIKVYDILSEDYKLETKYDLVFNQCCRNKELNHKFQSNIDDIVSKSELYFQTFQNSNYFNTAYPFYSVKGGKLIEIRNDIINLNPYLTNNKFISELGLTSTRKYLKSLTINNEINQSIKEIAQKLKVDKIILLNLFNNDFEDNTNIKMQEILHIISKLISKNYLVLFFSDKLTNQNQLNEIKRNLNKVEKDYLISNFSQCDDNSELFISLLSLVDLMVSTEDGFSEIAKSIGISVDVIKKNEIYENSNVKGFPNQKKIIIENIKQELFPNHMFK